MDKNKIVGALSHLGNIHRPSLNDGTVTFSVGDAYLTEWNDKYQQLSIEIAFPLVSMNPEQDEPQSVLVLKHRDLFSNDADDQFVIDTVYGYALEYYESYVKPVAGLVKQLNRGKFFNKPKGRQAEWNL